MMVPNIWFFLILVVYVTANIDLEEKFCGRKLVMTLDDLCEIYNYPSFGRNRIKRQIIDECCNRPCSKRHLVQYYCKQPKNSAINLLTEAKSDISDKSVQAPPPNVVPSNAAEKIKTLPVRKIIGEPSFHRKLIERRRKCKCRKRRAKNVKKPKNLSAVPSANIGHVERSQTPFYVWKFARML